MVLTVEIDLTCESMKYIKSSDENYNASGENTHISAYILDIYMDSIHLISQLDSLGFLT